MGKNPAFQFYPADWTRDLDDFDLEIEGAWIRIMCRLWWSPERGKMTKTLRDFARILRKTEKKTLKILQILIEKGVASGQILDNQNITIISRRMVKDDKISQIRKEVGKLGGNPGLKKIRSNLDNQSSNQNSQSSSSSSSSNKEKINKKEKEIFGEFQNVKLTADEFEKLKNQFGEQGTKQRIENLSSYIASKGKKYSSHYATILTWERKNKSTNSKPKDWKNSF